MQEEQQKFRSFVESEITLSNEIPVISKEQVLPLTTLNWKTFEQLCCRLIARERNTEGTPFLYGVPGEDQKGIDIVARKRTSDDLQTWCYQCKNHQYFSPSEFEKAIKALEYKADHYVFTIACKAGTGLRDTENKYDVELWDVQDISFKLKDHPDLVADFFGVAWVQAFCVMQEEYIKYCESPSQQTNSKVYKKVMVSSTVQKLPEHYKEVLDACARQGMIPLLGDHSSADAAESLRAVDEADIYLGIFAYHYGYSPQNQTISIPELEYNRATERHIPRIVFLIHQEHLITINDVDFGEEAIKLQQFKTRLEADQPVNFFTSPADLHTQLISRLSHFRYHEPTAVHYISNIPIPPTPYIAHPYTLLQTPTLVGRQSELNLLTSWVTNPHDENYAVRILNIVALGGLGKSALIWKWFQDIAPMEFQPLEGRIWWSFYESDATFEQFILRVLAYVKRQPREKIQKLSLREREEQLLDSLDHEPYLIVFDGLERLLFAYQRMDAAYLIDDELEERTAKVLAEGSGLPESAAQSFTGQHYLRKFSDSHVAVFLRKLATVHSSRVLVSTRLYPTDLQTSVGNEVSGSKAFFLGGLTDDDAVNLWNTLGVKGSREKLLQVFLTFDKHPLLIQVLAGMIAQDRRAPGDFDQWHKTHPDFSPFFLTSTEAKKHILKYALNGLDPIARQVLFTISAFSMPTTYDTLVALLVSGEGEDKPCSDETILSQTLANLEDRGLLGWDRRANRYDLHPIVRGVVWSELGNRDKRDIYEALDNHFSSLGLLSNELEITSLDDLTSIIEWYTTLIGLDRDDDAESLYYDRLRMTMRYQLGESRECVKLLEQLFRDKRSPLPKLSTSHLQSRVFNELALCMKDQPGQAAKLFRQSNEIDLQSGDLINYGLGLSNLSEVLRWSGKLYESEAAARNALVIARQFENDDIETISLQLLGIVLAIRGMHVVSEKIFGQSIELAHIGDETYEAYSDRAMLALWLEHYDEARSLAIKAMKSCQQSRYEWGMISAMRLEGAASLGRNDLSHAEICLFEALDRARKINLVEEEIPAVIGLAEIQRRQGSLKEAYERLEYVWERVEKGPFRLFHTDAYNLLTQIESDKGNHLAAVEAATKAYHLAWCDGPPFAYHWGLQIAKAHLSALDAPEPELSPFIAAKYEPMPDVVIIPPETVK